MYMFSCHTCSTLKKITFEQQVEDKRLSPNPWTIPNWTTHSGLPQSGLYMLLKFSDQGWETE